MNPPRRRLDRLAPGESGRVISVAGDDPVSVRLLEMGLLPGEAIEVIGRAPLGDPMTVLIRGTRLAMRRRDAARIEVLTGSEDSAAGEPVRHAVGAGVVES